MRAQLLALVAVAAALAGAAARPADAARECDGLIVCIPVAGPWVQVLGGARPTYYRLACPGAGQTIGGIDADRAGRLGIGFQGLLGGPVGPGVTTGHAAIFEARAARRVAGFRPLLGCIPGGGGGGRGRTVREPSRSLQAVAPRPEATVWRVRNVRLAQRERQRLTHACLAGERLLSFSVAVAFRQARRPSLATLGSVRASVRRSGHRVVVDARSGVARPVGIAAEVQVQALCARSTR